VDVYASLPPLALPGRILNELCAHALETLPEECCGLILGREPARYGRLVRCRNEMTRRHLADPVTHPCDGRAAFWMNEADYLHAQALAETAGEEVTAVYHCTSTSARTFRARSRAAEHALFVPGRRPDVIAVHERRVVGSASISAKARRSRSRDAASCRRPREARPRLRSPRRAARGGL
jgi:hypothetical protein